MKKFSLEEFRKSGYRTLNWVEISKKALIKNHKALQILHPQSKICPVLKSNAYGHGFKQIAEIFDTLNYEFLIVDSLFEAYKLQKLKIKTRILIMGYTAPVNFSKKKLNFDFAVSDIQTARALDKYQKNCRVHIFIDTGMRREGVLLSELSDFLNEIKELKNLKVVGLCSHFSDTDNPKSLDFTNMQIQNYNKALMIFKQKGLSLEHRHISASAGAIKIYDKDFNMIRAGIAHYGITPLEKNDKFYNKLSLTPALQLCSTLAMVKHIKKGDSVGYSRKFKAKKDMTIGLLPAGYYEGVERSLSNKGFVKIRKFFYPIIGQVSMNMTTIDITNLKNPKIGEKVIIYSSNVDDKNSILNSAILVGTIPYVLLANIAESVRRKIVD